MKEITAIALAITGVAILSVILSPKSKTSQVIQAAASGFSNSLGAALSPVTGAKINVNTQYLGNGSPTSQS